MKAKQHGGPSVSVPQLAWWGDIEAELAFPEGWKVTECRMNGHDTSPLDDAGFVHIEAWNDAFHAISSGRMLPS